MMMRQFLPVFAGILLAGVHATGSKRNIIRASIYPDIAEVDGYHTYGSAKKLFEAVLDKNKDFFEGRSVTFINDDGNEDCWFQEYRSAYDINDIIVIRFENPGLMDEVFSAKLTKKLKMLARNAWKKNEMDQKRLEALKGSGYKAVNGKIDWKSMQNKRSSKSPPKSTTQPMQPSSLSGTIPRKPLRSVTEAQTGPKPAQNRSRSPKRAFKLASASERPRAKTVAKSTGNQADDFQRQLNATENSNLKSLVNGKFTKWLDTKYPVSDRTPMKKKKFANALSGRDCPYLRKLFQKYIEKELRNPANAL